MDISQETQYLQKIPLFSKIGTARLKLLAFASERQVFQAQECLIQEGEIGTCAYVILRGQVEVTIQRTTHVHQIALLGDGEIIGELAILCESPRIATVCALTEVDTLCISKETFLEMIQEFPDMAQEVIRVIAHRLSQAVLQLKNT